MHFGFSNCRVGDSTSNVKVVGDFADDINLPRLVDSRVSAHLRGARLLDGPDCVAKEPHFYMSNRPQSRVQNNFQPDYQNNEKSLQSFRMIQMLFHPQASVRMQLIDRREAPLEILMQLTRDVSVDVRFALAENHNVAEEILLELISDENPYVQERARKTFLRKRKAEMTDMFRRLHSECSLIEGGAVSVNNHPTSHTAL